jgi:RNA polymerase-binding protein DksA
MTAGALPTSSESATGSGPATSSKSAHAPAPRKRAPRKAAAPAPITDWSAQELAEARVDLEQQVAAMGSEYDRSIADLEELHHNPSVGAGDDQADAGSATFGREQELSIVANRRNLIEQMQRAIARVDAGTYGLCESCGRAIPKARLQAFPAATLDVECKQREERR